MGQRGPNPKPTQLKVIEGNPGKRPLQPDAINVKVEAPDCPDHLSEVAREEWQRITRELVTYGLVGEIDRSSLAAYCQLYGRWVEAENQLAAFGMMISTPNGYVVQSPWLAVANKALEQMRQYASEFGMTPAARTRVRGTAQLMLDLGDEDEDGPDEFGRYMNGPKAAV